MDSLRTREELTDEERAEISREFFSRFVLDRDQDPYRLHSEVLMSRGVMCPHPSAAMVARRGGGDCRACGCHVLGARRAQRTFPALDRSAA